MSLSEEQRQQIEAFREYIEDSVAGDDRYGPPERIDREDWSTLATRFEAGPSCWFEVALCPMVPQIRVSFLTDDRWKSEEIEQAIQDSGDTMEEFVQVGLEEAGLDWSEPTVEHFRDADQHYCFATPMELEDLDDLDLEQIRSQTLRMLEGYLIVFGPAIEIEQEDDDLYDDEEEDDF